MRHRVDIDYNLDPQEMLEWCDEHLNGPITCPDTGGWKGEDWMIFHTSGDEMPYYIITRCLFDREEDAILFRLRWG